MRNKLDRSVVRRESTADQVRQTLLTRILDGTYKPGDRLKELLLAREFNVSQAPVREALRGLMAANIVETVPYKGARVRVVSDMELQQAYVVRALLEGLAGQLAAPRFKGDTEELKAHADAIKKAVKRKDMRQYAEHDYPFHRAIVERSGNHVLLRIWEQLHFEVRTTMYLFRPSARLAEAEKYHHKIVDALERGNGSEAGKLLRQHSGAFADELKSQISNREARGSTSPGRLGRPAR
jgi:DNA-binding GntR family transcriptional regulator